MKNLIKCSLSIALIAFSSPSFAAAPPPFACTIWCGYELATGSKLTEVQKKALQDVQDLFQNAEAGKGIALKLFYAEVVKMNPEGRWELSEVALTLHQMNIASYRNTSCFQMIEQGVLSVLPMFQRYF